MKIINSYLSPPNVWDDTWQSCEHATFFQSRQWAGVWEAYSKGVVSGFPLVVEFSDGTSVVWPFSVSRSGRFHQKTFLSSPAGTYGGWLSRQPLSAIHIDLLFRHMSKLGGMDALISPYDPAIDHLRPHAAEIITTSRLSLEGGMPDIVARWSKGHKAAPKQARRSGVAIERATTKRDWSDYFNIYTDSLKRWGDKATSQYGWNLFEAIYDLHSPNVKLWLAKKDNEVIAGALCFYSHRKVIYWHGAALESSFKDRPVNLLIHDMIEDACHGEYEWFDFNPSGSLEGVRAFKAAFGADESACLHIVNRTRLQAAITVARKFLQ